MRAEYDWRWVLAGTLANAAAVKWSWAAHRKAHADVPWLDRADDDWYSHPVASHYLTLAYAAQCQLSCFGCPDYVRLTYGQDK